MAIKLNSQDTKIILACIGLMEDTIDFVGIEELRAKAVKNDLKRLSASYAKSLAALERCGK